MTWGKHLGNDRTRRHTWEGSLEADVLQLRDRAGQAEPDHAHAQAAHPVPADVTRSTPHPLEVLRHRVTPGHTAAYDRAVSRGEMRWDGCHSSPAICRARVQHTAGFQSSDVLGVRFARRDKPPARREVVPRRCNTSTCTASCSCLDGATRCAVHVLCARAVPAELHATSAAAGRPASTSTTCRLARHQDRRWQPSTAPAARLLWHAQGGQGHRGAPACPFRMRKHISAVVCRWL